MKQINPPPGGVLCLLHCGPLWPCELGTAVHPAKALLFIQGGPSTQPFYLPDHGSVRWWSRTRCRPGPLTVASAPDLTCEAQILTR